MMEQDDRGQRSYQLPTGGPQPNTISDNALFMDSTISKDDTVEDLSKKREMLSKFAGEPGRGEW